MSEEKNNITVLEEKAISELLSYQFFIPSYQRGFRWTEQQVDDLLSDIDKFIPKQVKNSDKTTWYCLQPIVVKECDEKIKEHHKLTGTWYEVIDGQQRLTTIFLINHYANEMWIGKQKNLEFQIMYETRDISHDFLRKINVEDLSKQVTIDDSNIDFFHISKAYEKIHHWVTDYKNENHKELDNNDFQSKFKSHSKIIWYEVPSSHDSVEIFTRINMGKIPLTNAELIKSLFLNSSNFKDSDSEEVRLKQLEISSEWDRIEYTLQNNEFWYFINKNENNLSTRIEFIFNLMEEITGIKKDRDQYSTFRFFSTKFKDNTANEIEANWGEIKTLYQTLEEWFSNRELYHKIGYLISTGTDLKDLIIASNRKEKTLFKTFLNEEISKKIECKDVSDLEYKKDDFLIRKILLLHNIQTMLNNENETSRFPFNRYKTEQWDIEHIHAIASEMPISKQHRIDWLNNSKEFIDDNDLNFKISDFIKYYDEKIKSDPDSFEIVSKMVLFFYAERSNDGMQYEDINDIRNLVLLDSGTNRAYKNAVFPAKRKFLLNREKIGTFIPICTKNVFMKFYNNNVSQMTFWDEKDRESYLENIKITLFPTQL